MMKQWMALEVALDTTLTTLTTLVLSANQFAVHIGLSKEMRRLPTWFSGASKKAMSRSGNVKIG